MDVWKQCLGFVEVNRVEQYLKRSDFGFLGECKGFFAPKVHSRVEKISCVWEKSFVIRVIEAKKFRIFSMYRRVMYADGLDRSARNRLKHSCFKFGFILQLRVVDRAIN